VHGRARILAVDPGRIHREIERSRVVIVSGFQGISEEMEVTTLGRGASDLTAVALAAALDAGRCEIYTDVDGVYTADPRIEPAARPLRDISYEEMLEFASQGARVMNPRAVDLGSVYGVAILVASSFSDSPGTLIHGGADMEQYNKVRGIAHDFDVAKVTVRGVPDRPGIAAAIFEPLAEQHISVDTIVQNASVEKLTDMTFTVSVSDLPKAEAIVERIAKEIGASEVIADDALGKVSIVGTGIQSAPGYAARTFRVLSDQGINVELISTGEIRITCIIRRTDVEKAVQTLHKTFQLEKAEPSEL
jgi:aspartate kinase